MDVSIVIHVYCEMNELDTTNNFNNIKEIMF